MGVCTSSQQHQQQGVAPRGGEAPEGSGASAAANGQHRKSRTEFLSGFESTVGGRWGRTVGANQQPSTASNSNAASRRASSSAVSVHAHHNPHQHQGTVGGANETDSSSHPMSSGDATNNGKATKSVRSRSHSESCGGGATTSTATTMAGGGDDDGHNDTPLHADTPTTADDQNRSSLLPHPAPMSADALQQNAHAHDVVVVHPTFPSPDHREGSPQYAFCPVAHLESAFPSRPMARLLQQGARPMPSPRAGSSPNYPRFPQQQQQQQSTGGGGGPPPTWEAPMFDDDVCVNPHFYDDDDVDGVGVYDFPGSRAAAASAAAVRAGQRTLPVISSAGGDVGNAPATSRSFDMTGSIAEDESIIISGSMGHAAGLSMLDRPLGASFPSHNGSIPKTSGVLSSPNGGGMSSKKGPGSSPLVALDPGCSPSGGRMPPMAMSGGSVGGRRLSVASNHSAASTIISHHDGDDDGGEAGREFVIHPNHHHHHQQHQQQQQQGSTTDGASNAAHVPDVAPIALFSSDSSSGSCHSDHGSLPTSPLMPAASSKSGRSGRPPTSPLAATGTRAENGMTTFVHSPNDDEITDGDYVDCHLPIALTTGAQMSSAGPGGGAGATTSQSSHLVSRSSV